MDNSFCSFWYYGLSGKCSGNKWYWCTFRLCSFTYGITWGILPCSTCYEPLIVFLHTQRNPYPLVFATLRESGLYAFFTRSSAANIPVNLSLCKRLGLNEDIYSISIPLGATINMSGAAITIAILSLAAAHTLGIEVDILMALLLSIIATVGACGASGVAGGSLLLIPVACASFGISNDIAMQVVGVGFIIGVLQDSCETALNSSSDVLFTATAEFATRHKEGTLDIKDMVPQNRI